jgi:hypothetical protein
MLVPCQSVPAPGNLGRRVGGHPQGPLEDSLHDLRTTGEWNTTAVPIQLRGTWDNIREAGNLAWPGSKVPSGLHQHWVTWAQSQRTPPRSLEDSFWDRPPNQAPDIRAPSLPEERCPGGLWRSTGGSHLGFRIPPRLVCRGESVDYRS